MKKIKVNQNCIGCGACTSIANKYFTFSPEGYSTPITTEVKKDDEATVMEAAEACPVDAIEVTDDENK